MDKEAKGVFMKNSVKLFGIMVIATIRKQDIDIFLRNLYNYFTATYYFKEKFMAETKVNSLEYLSGAFKGLSVEKKDYILNTAKSLLEIQDANIYPVNSKTVSRCEREGFTFGETPSVYPGDKI
jgi:hypothetical protein